MFRRTAILAAVTWAIVFAAAPAWADFNLERRLALDPGKRFTLDTAVGTVTLTGDSRSGAMVTVTARRDDFDQRFDFQFEESAAGVRVTVTRRTGWLLGLFGGDWFQGDNVRFVIRVPRTTTVNLATSGGSVNVSGVAGETRVRSSGGSLDVANIEGDVQANTSGGSISVRGVRGDVVVHTSGGSIQVADVRGAVRADTSGGGIQVDSAAKDVFAQTSGGSVRIREAGGRVEAHSSGGPVTVGFAAGNGHGGVLSSSGGGVRAELDPAVGLSIDASSSGGGVNCDLPITTRGDASRSLLRGDINGGGSLLRLRSSGGAVRISGV